MAIAYSGRSASNNARATSVTCSMTVSTGDFIVLVGGVSGGSTFTPSTTGIGGTWNAVSTPVTNTAGIQIFWNNTWTASSGSSVTFSLTTNTSRDSEIIVFALTGVKTTSPVDAFGNATSSSPLVTTATSGDLVIGAVSSNNNTAWTAGTIGGTAATLIANTGADQGALAVEFLVVGSPTSYTCTFVGGGGTVASQAVGFIDAGAGGGATIIRALACTGAGS